MVGQAPERQCFEFAVQEMGLGWVNWRSLRTSHAVWLKLAGADVKDVQGQLRHSRANATLDIYQQFVPEVAAPGSGAADELGAVEGSKKRVC